jgi:Lar family restriction alleviation protein
MFGLRRNNMKKCPKCGGQAEVYSIHPSNNHFVKCNYCGISTEVYRDKDKAITAWNKRIKLSRYN